MPIHLVDDGHADTDGLGMTSLVDAMPPLDPVGPVHRAFSDPASECSEDERAQFADHPAWPDLEAAWAAVEGLAALSPTFAAALLDLRSLALPRVAYYAPSMLPLFERHDPRALSTFASAIPRLASHDSALVAREILGLDDAAFAGLAAECATAYVSGVAALWPHIPGKHGPTPPPIEVDYSLSGLGALASSRQGTGMVRFFPLRAAAVYALARAIPRLAGRVGPEIADALMGTMSLSMRMGPNAVHELLHVAGDRIGLGIPARWIEPFSPATDAWHALLARSIQTSRPYGWDEVSAVIWGASAMLLSEPEARSFNVVDIPMGGVALEEGRATMLEQILLIGPGLEHLGPPLLWAWEPGVPNRASSGGCSYDDITTVLLAIHGPSTPPAELIQRLARPLDRRYARWLVARVRRTFGVAAADAFLEIMLAGFFSENGDVDRVTSTTVIIDEIAARYATVLGLQLGIPAPEIA